MTTLFIAGLPSAADAELPRVSPADAGMRPDFAADVDRHVERALAEKKAPGCVVVVARGGAVVLEKAWGLRQVEPTAEPMTVDTVFDLASLTKPIATSTSIMQLVERGDVRVRDRVVDYLPEFTGDGREKVTVEQLMIHTSGLAPVLSADDFLDGWAAGYKKICESDLRTTPGEAFRYSDLGFLLLGEIVARVSGRPLNEYAAANIYAPLGMRETGYLPAAELASRIAPTERVDGRFLRGVVHDPRARLMGGVAGHAGLFSTAGDLTLYAQAALDTLKGKTTKLLQPQTLRMMPRPRPAGENLRGLGWDKRSVYSRNRGETMTDAAFGHGGFTGTAIWIDPGLDLFVIFLSNRLHPTGDGEVNDLAGRIATIASAACLEAPPTAAAPKGDEPVAALGTRLGIDVLAENGFAPLRGGRVGLVANHTSRNAAGVSTIDLLAKSAEVDLVALFSPEHGIRGELDQANIADSTDEATGLPIRSLYGATRKPTPEQLADVDTLVFDIQDIGCRFYTYISTLGLVMEAAGEQGKRVVVLDRPNPIGGHRVEGPMLDDGAESFVAFHKLPIRHGMTVGELARMMNAERQYKADLSVIPIENWRRDALLFDTGLPWVNTSPNMRSLTQALLYPGVGIYETTNLSVGRGTDTPFEILGAPWIDERLAPAITSHQPAGVRVTPIEFTPDSSKHRGEACRGVRFTITDWEAFRPMELGWAIGLALAAEYPNAWQHERLPRLLGSQRAYDAIVRGMALRDIERDGKAPLESFLKRRRTFLLY